MRSKRPKPKYQRYDGCCTELDWDGKPDRDHILSVGDVKKISASLSLSLSYKEVGQVISSQAIVMKGQLMNAIKTISIDGQEKEWFLLNKPKSIFGNLTYDLAKETNFLVLSGYMKVFFMLSCSIFYITLNLNKRTQ